MSAPVPVTPPEVATASLWCQRWRRGQHSWRHVRDGGFDARRYRVEPIEEATARSWVVANHYSRSYPAASRRYGLFAGEQLVGACVLGVPMSDRVLTNVFPDLQPVRDALELSRLVLDDVVPGNGESWFLARVFEAEAERGLCGVVAFADPVPRRVGGRVLFAGHTGHIYVAANAAYLGRGTARTMTVLPDGVVLSARSAQKVRAGERGHAHVEQQLVRLGATPRHPHADPAAWLRAALHEIGATRTRHAGNHRYAFRLGRTARARRRVQLGMPRQPRPRVVDESPPEQLALFASG